MGKRSIGSNVERRAFASAIEVETRDDGAAMIRGHAAVFDKLSENLGGFREKIAPGAFDGRLADDVRGLFNHDSNYVLGRTTSGTMRLGVDAEGLTYEIDPPDTSYARDLMVSMKRGDISQSSFAFTVDSDDWQEDDEGRVVRTITGVRQLYDVSPVTYPAYPDAGAAVRSFNEYMESRQRSVQEAIELEAEIRRRKLKLIELGA